MATGVKATFKVVAAGSGLSYDWQYSTDCGRTWNGCQTSGHDSATFGFKPSASLNGRMYRCIIKNSFGTVYTEPVMLNITDVAPKIVLQPTQQTVSAGSRATFKVVAAGGGLTYQWQYYTGYTWKDCSSAGYNTDTLSFKASDALNGRWYRCVVSNSYGTVISNECQLTVK